MSSKARLLELFNKKRSTAWVEGDVAFSAPQPIEAAVYSVNTRVFITTPAERAQLHYDRTNIADVGAGGVLGVVAIDPVASDSDILNAIRAEYNLQLFDSDVGELKTTPVSPYLRTLVIASGSFEWYGAATVFLIPERLTDVDPEATVIIGPYRVPTDLIT